MPGRIAPTPHSPKATRWLPDTPLPASTDHRPEATAARLAVLAEAAPFLREIELAEQYAMAPVNGTYYVNVRPGPALEPDEERPIPETGLGRLKTGFFDLGGLRARDPEQAAAERDADIDRFLALRRTEQGATELVVVTRTPAEDRAVTRGRYWKAGVGTVRLFTPEDETRFMARKGYPRTAPDRFLPGEVERPLRSPLTEAAEAMPARVSWIAEKRAWAHLHHGLPEHPLVIEARAAHTRGPDNEAPELLQGMAVALSVVNAPEVSTADAPRLRVAAPRAASGVKA